MATSSPKALNDKPITLLHLSLDRGGSAEPPHACGRHPPPQDSRKPRRSKWLDGSTSAEPLGSEPPKHCEAIRWLVAPPSPPDHDALLPIEPAITGRSGNSTFFYMLDVFHLMRPLEESRKKRSRDSRLWMEVSSSSSSSSKRSKHHVCLLDCLLS